jgi:hypothetical protein
LDDLLARLGVDSTPEVPGRFPTLGAVVEHYNTCFSLGVTAGQQGDLVQYLKSL